MTEENKAIVPVEQKVVEFYGDELTAVLLDRQGREIVYVPVRPISDYLGVDWSAQYRRINRDPVLSSELIPCVVVTATQGQPDQRRDMLCLPLDMINGFLFGISADRVREELRERVIQYQRECYRVLADAFVNQDSTVDGLQASSESMMALQQIRENALAVARLAEEQMRMMGRLDKAAVIVGRHEKRITALERRLAPGNPINEEQAAEIADKVKALAMLMAEYEPGKNHFQGIFSELYRRFGVSSYKLIPQGRYAAVLSFLDEWHGRVGKGR